MLGISPISLALRGEAVLQVIIAVGQAEAALAQGNCVDFRVFEIDIDAGAERRGVEIRCALAHQAGDGGKIGGVADGVELGGDGAGAGAVDGRLVHERGVERADLALDVRGLLADAVRRLFEQRLELLVGAIGHLQPPGHRRATFAVTTAVVVEARMPPTSRSGMPLSSRAVVPPLSCRKGAYDYPTWLESGLYAAQECEPDSRGVVANAVRLDPGTLLPAAAPLAPLPDGGVLTLAVVDRGGDPGWQRPRISAA